VYGIEERFGFVKVPVADVRVEHQVKIADFIDISASSAKSSAPTQ